MAGPLYTSNATDSNLTTVTFANLPASAPLGAQIYVSDIGEYGAVYTGNGTSWAIAGTIEIMQRAKGWLVPSLAAANAATYSQTGNVITVTSTGHNIPATGYNTKDVYLEMGTAATGATIPPGWFSNFTYVSADAFTCVSTVSQTGTGAVNTNLARTDITELTSVIPGGTMGLNGMIVYSFLYSFWDELSTPLHAYLNFGGTDFYSKTVTATGVDEPRHNAISNRNSFTSQAGSALDDTPASIVLGAIDTTIDQNIVISLKSDAANRYMAIHSAVITLSPS